MMKRVVWTGMGYTLGIGTSLYVQRRVRRTVERYAPDQVRTQISATGRVVADRAREIALDLRDAAQEGAAAMREEQADLQAEFAGSRTPHRGPARAIEEARPSSGRGRPRR